MISNNGAGGPHIKNHFSNHLLLAGNIKIRGRIASLWGWHRLAELTGRKHLFKWGNT